MDFQNAQGAGASAERAVELSGMSLSREANGGATVRRCPPLSRRAPTYTESHGDSKRIAINRYASAYDLVLVYASLADTQQAFETGGNCLRTQESSLRNQD